MKGTKKAKQPARFSAMKADELREATASYGREMIVERFSPLSAQARKRWEDARRKPGRPRRGKGAKVISVTVERELLAQSDRLATSMGVSRAGLIQRGLKAVLAAEGKL